LHHETFRDGQMEKYILEQLSGVEDFLSSGHVPGLRGFVGGGHVIDRSSVLNGRHGDVSGMLEWTRKNCVGKV
jgi:hypothetical protein